MKVRCTCKACTLASAFIWLSAALASMALLECLTCSLLFPAWYSDSPTNRATINNRQRLASRVILL
ncbi:hypothetical protein D3C72_1914940 [compost metagenome]